MNNRRHFIAAAAATAAAALIPLRASAAVNRVVVVGGGMAGATVAKYLRLWSNRTLDVTLVEQNPTYVSNIMSNLAVTGQVALSSLNFGYAKLVSKYGVKLVTASVTAVEPAGAGLWKVTTRTANGSVGTLHAERVVLAPGIQMDPVPETSDPTRSADILHAWIAGPQTNQLRQRLAAMAPGGTFVMSIPPKPYRCPPGPYERACVVADYLKRNKPNSRLVVLDANPGISAEPENFGYAFGTLYPSVLQYVPNAKVVSVDSPSGTVTADVTVSGVTTRQQFASNVLNVIPPHRAGAIVQLAGLANATDQPFAQVWPYSFESVAKPGLHVIGDSHRTAGTGGTGLPMAGHVGNQEAKICASAIVSLLAGKSVDTALLAANSACYSPVSSTLASWLTAVYHYEDYTDPKTLLTSRKFVIHDYVSGSTGVATEALKPSSENFSKMNTWFKSLMAESYS
ncbi:FAD/NAD(P)-binding oxidoreductase [Malikia sp.]|uniref:FAD-dependent oxidoreductase n=1 Tax=Malikia sp. TaxID=2070706 RepID=UPI00262DD71F|nr:FAD/NAD(P)-binding oxidoreductase [Malikia sp.]MDD2727632.1 FAD/NAD(P)-binding oxidoreductase [Malikia sp.]